MANINTKHFHFKLKEICNVHKLVSIVFHVVFSVKLELIIASLKYLKWKSCLINDKTNTTNGHGKFNFQ